MATQTGLPSPPASPLTRLFASSSTGRIETYKAIENKAQLNRRRPLSEPTRDSHLLHCALRHKLLDRDGAAGPDPVRATDQLPEEGGAKRMSYPR